MLDTLLVVTTLGQDAQPSMTGMACNSALRSAQVILAQQAARGGALPEVRLICAECPGEG
jgi:hypothetical protein